VAFVIAMTLANLLRRALARLALEAFRMFTTRRLDAGMSLDIAVATANLLGRAVLGLTF
jgi:hypothetical protein